MKYTASVTIFAINWIRECPAKLQYTLPHFRLGSTQPNTSEQLSELPIELHFTLNTIDVLGSRVAHQIFQRSYGNICEALDIDDLVASDHG
jgi:hypothetical protein